MKTDYKNKKRRTVINIGENVFMPPTAKITVPNFSIGDYSRINGPIVVRGRQDCVIGKYCAFGYNITVITTNHFIGKPNLQVNMQRYYGFSDLEVSKGPVSIGNNVWIGDNVTILSGVAIADGCVVGAGAVVNKDLPACSVSAGVPAKVIKYRFSQDVIDEFLKISWWNWPQDKIACNKKFFDTDLSKCKAADLAKIIQGGRPCLKKKKKTI
ncbi:MAG: CatB-related O-acetyltransferase [Candidatus Omnitrophica bacterium]|nr:CatB-related O-acetyltransferase [Candidatus Omnitrophota bacterium]